MANITEQLAEALSGQISRRGFFSRILRTSVNFSLGISSVCTGALTFTTVTCHSASFGSQDNHCSSGDIESHQGYCEANSSTFGCNTGEGGYPECTLAQGCKPTNPTSGSNCGDMVDGEIWESKGYWDCCCDGRKFRCRDCGPKDGDIVCICRAEIGDCTVQTS